MQSPTEVWTWAFYNCVLYALIPYVVFRSRGYSREQVNLRSTDWKNDTFIVLMVLLIGCGLELLGPNIFQLTPHRQIVGGSLSFFVHLLGTDLPVMIFILRNPRAEILPAILALRGVSARSSELPGTTHLRVVGKL